MKDRNEQVKRQREYNDCNVEYVRIGMIEVLIVSHIKEDYCFKRYKAEKEA